MTRATTTAEFDVVRLSDAELIEEWERANEAGTDAEVDAVNAEVAKRERERHGIRH